jgi:MFS transporter, ACS family, hexuronate transporter
MNGRTVWFSAQPLMSITPASSAPPTKYRWVVCALLFAATTINYVDRNSLSVLKPILEKKLGWSEADYGWITFAFTLAYAIFPSIAGRLMDVKGVKFGLSVALILWSVMAGAHALATTVLGFALARFFLGAAEAANFPASINAVAQWFPRRERALATGLFNSGTNVGVMISFGVVWVAQTFSWQAAFISIGAIGLLWLGFWQWGYGSPETHPRVSAAELAIIKSDPKVDEEKLNLHWTTLLRFKQIWPFLLAKFFTDPVWWFYLYWLPSYLGRERGRNPMDSALLLAVIYTGASIGSIAGGWFSGALMGRGWTTGAARMLALAVPAICMPCSILAYSTANFTLCVALISLATACHQAWSANVFTSATDLFPAKIAGSVVGLGATTGAMGGMFMTLLAALSIQWLGTYRGVFIWAGLMHPAMLVVYWLWLRGNFEPVDVDTKLDESQSHGVLQGAGAMLAVVGAAGAWLIYANWELCVKNAKMAGAAGGMTAAIGLALVGAMLIYAGMAKTRAATA